MSGGGEYRDPLAAAHARIAELEARLRLLEEEAAPKPLAANDGRFPDLEAEVERLRKPADAAANARRRAILSKLSVVFPFVGMVLSFLQVPLAAAACSAVFIALVIYNLSLSFRLKKAKHSLTEAEAKLTAARHIADLESKLAATTKLRVEPSTEPEPAAESEAPAEALRRAAR